MSGRPRAPAWVVAVLVAVVVAAAVVAGVTASSRHPAGPATAVPPRPASPPAGPVSAPVDRGPGWVAAENRRPG